MTLHKLVSMRAALSDPAYFCRSLGGDSWRAWRAVPIAIVGEELTDEERATINGLRREDHLSQGHFP